MLERVPCYKNRIGIETKINELVSFFSNKVYNKLLNVKMIKQYAIAGGMCHV